MALDASMPENEETKSRPHKILVVDDEEDLEILVRQRMRREIRRGVYSFEFAGNGEEALEKLKQTPDIDVVLTDINMPKMDGLTLLSKLDAEAQDLRSVVISAYGDIKNIRQAMNLGAFDFIVKPVDFTDLRVTIERTIKNLESWREALQARNQLAAIQGELEVASTMQESILPSTFPMLDNYRVHAAMSTAKEVGGDFYDVYELDDGRVGLAIADVSGKGVPAALFMMVSRTLLKGSAAQEPDPSLVLENVNNVLAADNDSMMFVTLIYAVYDPATNRLTYSNGGHNPMMIVGRDGDIRLEDPQDGVALGVMSDFEFKVHEIQLQEGDTVVFYTDGVNEAETADGDFFGMERFESLFENQSISDPAQITSSILAGVHAFVGNHPQSDDITCVALCLGPSTSSN